jgi:hypothetical protein
MQLLPEKLTAGDTWQWSITDLAADYPASAYTLKYFLRGPNHLDIVATADGDNFSVLAPAADTASLGAGTYAWSAAVFLISDGTRTELLRGNVEILPNLETISTDGYQGASHVKRVLDGIRAVIENRATRVEEEYQIGGRMLRLMKLEDLIKAEGVYASRYAQEQRESGQRSPRSNQVLVRFTNPRCG